MMAMERVLKKNPNIDITVVVPTQLLQDQWLEKLDAAGIQATVLVLNTAAEKPFKTHMLIVDEVHRSNSDHFRQLFLNCHPTFILGLTATYERLDGKEKEVLDKVAPICDVITIDEAIQNGWLSPYTEYKVVIDVDLTDYNKANQAFNQHFSFFGFDFDMAMKAATNAVYRNQLASRMGYSAKEVAAHAFAWMKAMKFRKQFISNHPKKIEVAKKILKARQDTKAITFNSSIKQCEAYGFGYVIHSEKKKKENAAILAEFAKCGPGAVLHNSKMAKEGYDCPGLGLAIITGFQSDKISKRQEIGRIIRYEEGKHAEVFVLVLKGCQDNKWYQKASEGMPYIEINEKELDDLLAGKRLNKTPKIQEDFYGIRY